MPAIIDERLKQLYEAWLSTTRDPVAAATLTLATVIRDTEQPGGSTAEGLLDLKMAASYLGYDATGLRKIVKQRQIQFVQNGRGPIKFRREWLDDFIAKNAGGPGELKRSAPQRHSKSKNGTLNHGFDRSLYHADSHKGAA